MKKQHTRSFSLALVLAMLLSAAACAEKTDDEDQVTQAQDNAVTEPGETEDPIMQYAPDLPERNYEGYGFRIISRDDTFHPYPAHTRDIIAEEINGDPINDAVHARNQKIEDEYGLTIKLTTFNEVTNETAPSDTVVRSVMANSDDYDLLLQHMINTGSAVLQDVFLNWNLLPCIDFDKPYWNKDAYEAFSVGDKTYMALSDMSFSSADNAHVMVFNKNLAQTYNIENLYDLVYNNQWTYEKFDQIAAQCSEDLNGNSKWDPKDRYGYLVGGDSSMINWMYAADLRIVEKDEDNYPYMVEFSDRMDSAYQYLYDLMKKDYTYLTNVLWVDATNTNMFMADQALIMSTQVSMLEHLRNMDSGYGSLPFPKYDEQQENYGHYVDGHATIMAIPRTIADSEMVGIFIEAMSFESFKSVLPIYLEDILTTKYVRDEDSIKMLELVYNTRVFDFAYVYDAASLSWCFKRASSTNALASYYKASEKAENKRIEKVVAVYESNN